MATVNGAKVIGQEDKLGRVRQGYIADLLVVNGNPLDESADHESLRDRHHDLRRKACQQLQAVAQGDPKIKRVHGGGIEWTIKDGIPYHVPTLMQEVKDMVSQARAEKAKKK